MLPSQKCAADHILRRKYLPSICAIYHDRDKHRDQPRSGTSRVAIVDRCRKKLRECFVLIGPHLEALHLPSISSATGIVPGSRANRNVWSAAMSKAKNEGDRLICANVFGLHWSTELLAMMECAAPSSYLVRQPEETFPVYRFRERRVRPLCDLMIRQQTWQKSSTP
jgi:hypothetical protein